MTSHAMDTVLTKRGLGEELTCISSWQDDLAISSYQAAQAQKRLADLKLQRASQVRPHEIVCC